MDLKSLEQELLALRPAAVSDKLSRHVGEITGEQPEAQVVFFPEAASLRRRVRRWQAGAAMAGAMAACLAIVLIANHRPDSGFTPQPALVAVPAAEPATVASVSGEPTAKPRLVDPVKVAAPAGSLVMMGREGRLQSAEQEGWLEQQDGTRARLVRLRYLDSVRWQDPSDKGAVIETTLPREQIVRVPSDETY